MHRCLVIACFTKLDLFRILIEYNLFLNKKIHI